MATSTRAKNVQKKKCGFDKKYLLLSTTKLL